MAKKQDPRAKACKAGYQKAKKLAERENRMRASAEAKSRRAIEKQWLKDEEKFLKQREAEGPCFELPALVYRTGGVPGVKSISLTDALDVVDMYADELCVDVEHSGYDLGHNWFELRTVQMGGEEAAVVLDPSDDLQAAIVSYGLNTAKVLHAHSAMADLSPLIKGGFADFDAVWDKMTDSVILAKLTDPKLSGSDANALKELSQDLLREYAISPAAEKAKNELFKAMGCLIDTESSTPREKNGWYQVNKFSETMIRYAGSDVLDLAAVVRILPPLPVDQSVLDREREYQKDCAYINVDGFPLNKPHIKKKIAENEAEKAEHQENVYVLSNGTITNPSAPDVGAKLLALYPGIELMRSEKTGEPSASKKSLETLKEDPGEAGILVREILAYRHNVTLLGLLLRPLEELCDNGDSRMRPTVLTINADTGRSSCVRPNGQQFARQGEVRKCVDAEPLDSGYVRFNADFAGCEIIVGAGLSGDEGLLEAERSTKCHLCQEDPCACGKKHTGLHWLAAHLTFGEGAVKEHRYKSKAVIFRKLFGGAPDSEIAVAIARTFDEQIAPVYKAWDDWLRKCWYQGTLVYRDYQQGENYSVDIPGRRRYGIYKTFNGRQIYAVKGAHAFGNYAIQGTARELLVEALIAFMRIVKEHPEWGVRSVLPVHDEILGFCKKEYFYEVTKALQECMTITALSTPAWNVTVNCDPELEPSTYWEDSS